VLSIRCPFASVELADDLSLSINGKQWEPIDRVISEMCEVAYDLPGIAKIPKDTVCYRMFRGVIEGREGEVFHKAGVRFDITAMADLPLGQELNKTLGHYHPAIVNGLSFPEIYQVIHGNAVYLLQKKEEGGSGMRLTDFVTVKAQKGDALLIPPNYGHVTVNVGPGPLLMANLVSDCFSSLYEEYIAKRGAAYYLLKENRLVHNTNYADPPKPRSSNPNFAVRKDLFTDFISSTSSFSCLNHPEELGNSLLP